MREFFYEKQEKVGKGQRLNGWLELMKGETMEEGYIISYKIGESEGEEE